MSSQDIIDEELQTFNWSEVDQYPSFEACNSSSETVRQQCFQKKITKHIMEHLSKRPIVVTKTVNDTIEITFLISEKGSITVQNIESDSLTKTQIPNFNKILDKSIKDLPTIFPAIKRGQQVKTEFKLPIIIKVK